ncbi:uncharacterized protein LOC118463872 isoform X2 [Anopheles albimanus]|uniref:uncharacterized protein LOC118463872 isoform X2 n=1 Tax=Anopheles albimanus TaxID=7167 RepID=UPI0016416543|nr:uncharacterized protein LOC118463872 isoform X2 [Anopheles albimanus]
MLLYRVVCFAKTKVFHSVNSSALCSASRTLYSNPRMNGRDVTKREKYFLQKDEIPSGFAIIYRAPMEYYISDILRCLKDISHYGKGC